MNIKSQVIHFLAISTLIAGVSSSSAQAVVSGQAHVVLVDSHNDDPKEDLKAMGYKNIIADDNGFYANSPKNVSYSYTFDFHSKKPNVIEINEKDSDGSKAIYGVITSNLAGKITLLLDNDPYNTLPRQDDLRFSSQFNVQSHDRDTYLAPEVFDKGGKPYRVAITIK